MIDRLTAYALFAGFIIAGAFGWDWDRSRQHPQRIPQRDGKFRGVFGGQTHGEAGK